jgi:DNA-binding CsgD family transcriptional regulator
LDKECGGAWDIIGSLGAHSLLSPRRARAKVEQVYQMRQKGASVKEIAEKMKLSERVVRSYIWRAKNPDKYRVLLKRYHEKKKARLANKAENSAEKV